MRDSGSPPAYQGGPPTVRTRFAPSPTGLPHIGGYRTVLFSWLLARRHGGQFVLRIEDTDQKRTVPGAVTNLLEGLAWLGIEPDEGPVAGGPVGPYFQSQRRDLYAQYAEQLIERDAAYRCFCSKERLDAMYKDQQDRHLPTTGYDRRCRALSSSEIAANLANGMSSVVRIKVPLTGETVVPDALRGAVHFQNAKQEDLVLLKSDGFPTYHLANVVDDHLMAITHVLRGDDWLPTAPLHVLQYQALGWDMPVLAHVPNVLGRDGKKLSKRFGAQPLLYYREQGYLPEAILNYLVLLGWSYDDKTDMLSVAEMQAAFGLERVGTAGAVFDEERMRWMNGVYLRQLAGDDLVARALPFLERPAAEGGLPDHVARPLDRAYVGRVVRLDQERMKVLSEAPTLTSYFFEDGALEYPAEWLIGKGLDGAGAHRALTRAAAIIAALDPWEPATLEAPLRALAEELGLKPGPLFMGIRVAVTGRKETPPLFETLDILGRARAVFRLQDALARLAAVAAG